MPVSSQEATKSGMAGKYPGDFFRRSGIKRFALALSDLRSGDEVRWRLRVAVQVVEELQRLAAIPQHRVACRRGVVGMRDGDGGGLRVPQRERHLDELVELRALVDLEGRGGPLGGGEVGAGGGFRVPQRDGPLDEREDCRALVNLEGGGAPSAAGMMANGLIRVP